MGQCVSSSVWFLVHERQSKSRRYDHTFSKDDDSNIRTIEDDSCSINSTRVSIVKKNLKEDTR